MKPGSDDVVLSIGPIGPCPRHPALTGLELEVRRGQIVALVGPPGCGKTRLLRIAAGLDDSVEAPRRATENLAYVFERGGLISNLTIFDNLCLPFSYRCGSLRHATEATRDAIEEFELEAVAELRPEAVSTEQQQIAQLARASLLEADLMLFDEVFHRLSRGTDFRTADWIAGCAEAGASFVIADQSANRMAELTTRIIKMRAPAGAGGRDTQITAAVGEPVR